MSDRNTVMQPARAGWVHRALGGLIVLKAALPLVLVMVLALGVWKMVAGIAQAVDEARRSIEPALMVVQTRIHEVQAEGQRLLGEVKKIKNTTTQIAGAVKESVEPIRQSLLGLSSALRAVAGVVAGVLNGIVRVINDIPMVKDLPYVHLPHVDIPGLMLPKLDLDLELQPNLQAVHEINAAAQAVALEAQRGIDRIGQTLRFWWWTIKVAAALLALWLILAVVGYAARVSHRIHTGFQMLCGRRVDGALALL